MLEWIKQRDVSIESKETILPTKSYFNHDFGGTEQDAEYVLSEVAKIFNTSVDDIELGFIRRNLWNWIGA